MNSFVNVQIRILASQAQARLAALNTQVAGMGAQWGAANMQVNQFGQSLGKLRLEALGSRVQWIGRQLEYNFTLPLLAAAAASFKFALDNEAAFTRVIKVYGDAAHGAEFYALEIQALSRAFEGLSNAYGVAQKDTIAIAADWAAAGSSGLALAKSVKLTMETMILGEMNAVDATKALIAIQAQYGFNTEKLIETISILNMVENQTGISLSGLVEGFARAAGVARSAGVDVRHLAAMLAALTPAAGSAAQAGNALKTIFSRILSPTEETTEVFALMGIHMDDLAWKSANMVDRLAILSTKFEELSDSQKAVVSSVVASRWQINKFEILMRELATSTGYYQKALESTQSAQANFTQMQRELNAVLESNPRKLQIIWTMLQNAMADVITPMIPMLLHLAQALQKLMSWFSSLNPSVQKLILAMLAFLAIIGPLTRYVGATILAIAELGKMFGLLLVPIKAVGNGLKWLLTIPIANFFKGAATQAAVFGGLLLVPFKTFFAWIAGPFKQTWVIIQTLWLIGMTQLAKVSRYGWIAIQVAFVQGMMALRGLIFIWTFAISMLWENMFARIKAMALAFWVFMTGGWRAMLIGIAAFSKKFLTMIAGFFLGIPALLKRIGPAITGALFGPWGIAIGLIVTLVITFWDQIKQVFFAGIEALKAGFRALPANIQASLLSILRSVAQIVLKIREWLSYINPWARHSPSLVDNVTTGVAEIIRQFSLLNNVNAVFARVGVSMENFAQSLFKARQMADQMQWDKIRQDIQEFAPALAGDFDNLIGILGSLRQELTDLQASYPIEAAKAMSDAIFENEMATKALQLQLMDMEAVVGPMDELESKIQAINGAMELLNGERTALRDAGAGSEILSQYDDQIGALEDQQSAIEAQLAPMRELAGQIEDLRREAERLQLAQSLQFDPIRREAEELIEAIGLVEDALNAMSQAAAAAGAAGSGAMSPGAQNFLDAAGGNFPDVGGFDQIGREGGIEDQSALIDQFTADLAKASADLFGAFDLFEPIRTAWNKGMEWIKSNIGPAASAIWGTFTGALEGMPNPFAGISFDEVWTRIEGGLNFLKGLFEDIWSVIKEPVMEVWDILKNTWGKITETIGPELAKFKDLVQPMTDLFTQLWDILKPVAAIIGGALLLAISILANVFSNVLGPIIDGIIEILAGVIKTLRGLIEFIVGVFTGDWELAWQGIKDFFGGIWDIIFGIVRTVLGLIWGVIRGVVEGIGDWWRVVWGKIGDTVKEVWNNILGFFKSAGDNISGVLKGIGNFIWASINNWIAFFQNLINWLWGLPGQLWNIGYQAFWNLVSAAKGALNYLIGLWNGLDFSINISIPSWVPIIGGKGFYIADVIPDIPYLARGGMIASEAMAVVGEGRKGYPEYVIPTDPQYRDRALSLFGELAQSLGVRDLLGKAMFYNRLKDGSGVAAEKISFYARGGTIGGRGTIGRGGITLIQETKTTIFNNFGNLEFPNIKDGTDAEEFLRNLEALMDEA